MAILFGTARTRFPDSASPTGGVQQLLDRSLTAVSGALELADKRIFNNSFVEDGVQNVTGSSFLDSKFSDLTQPSRRQVTTMFPQATVFLKKRMFSTLRSNYDIRFMDDQERIFVRSIKNLFRRKSEEIAFYENLVILEKVIEDPEFLNVNNGLDLMLSAFFTIAGLGFGIFDIETLFSQIGDGVIKPSPSVLFRLKRLQKRATQNKFTTWITDPDSPNLSGTGAGVGVIEFTWMTDISTTVSLDTGRGGCRLIVEDPYRLTRITETDIDLAIKQALAEENGPVSFFDVTAKRTLEEVKDLDIALNDLRRDRKVSEINFEFSPETDEPFFTIIELNQSYTVSQINDIPSDQALSAPEVTRAIAIINGLRSYKAIRDRSVTNVHNSNRNYAPVRAKMRNEFVGHHIFQQMDAIHVFANSFKRDETPIYANRTDLLINNSLAEIVTFEEQTGKMSDLALDAERQVVAPEMSLLEYKAFRNPTEFRGTGPQIFSGLVTDINSSYTARDGKFMLRVQAKDNVEFLNLSRINVQPGLTQPQGNLEDPLTPYDLKVNEETGLIEDRILSETNRKRLPFLRFDDGPLLGETVDSEDRVIQDTSKGDASDVFAYQHVPGLVYKWKQGIISATQEVNIIRPISRTRSILGDIREDYGVTITQSPFANLDSADIISILVTGQPYNYNNFIQSAIDAGNYTVDNDTNNRTYFNYLFDFLERQNQVFGNFVPGKISNIDPELTADAFRIQRQLTRINSRVTELQRQRAQLQDRIDAIGIQELSDGPPNPNSASQRLLNELQAQSNALSLTIAEINSEFDNPSFTLGEQADFKQYGNAVQVHFKDEDHAALKNRLKYIVKKKPEDVRFNQDKNYFLVSDKYDVDTDIQAFVLNLKQQGFALWDSEFKKPIDTCTQVAGIIDFEFFADSQGNIQFRNPQYNKTPLSLLIRMVELGRSDGISMLPKFLMKMIASRSDAVMRKLLRLELEIYELMLTLGVPTERLGADLAVNHGVTLALKDRTLVKNGKTIVEFDINKTTLFDSLKNDAVFNEKEQTNIIFSPPVDFDDRLTNTAIDPISMLIHVRNQLAKLKGSTTTPLSPEKTADRTTVQNETSKFDSSAKGTFANRLNLTNRIAQLVSQRQTLARAAERILAEEDELSAINDGAPSYNPFMAFIGSVAAAVSGQASDIPVIPKALEDLIEDDMSNMDGFNSGKRFIIEDKDIIDMDFAIKTPEFNRVDVNGDENLVGKELKGANGLLFWAGATDFDSWRQFGFRAEQTLNRPYLQDPETQCAPYAVFKLIQQRKKVHSGRVTVVGNEFYQAGDVVYVNNRQMLYYVNSVQHQISIANGTFRTVLDLTYGHVLGEYIPTPLDIIGKALLSDAKQHYGGIKANRVVTSAVDVVHLETLTFPLTAEIDNIERERAFRAGTNNADLVDRRLKAGQEFAKINARKARKAIQRARVRINKNNQDTARIEVRGYYLSGELTKYRTEAFITFTKRLLLGELSAENDIELAADDAAKITDGSIGLDAGFPLDSQNAIESPSIKTVDAIDLEKELTVEEAQLRYMPSSQAWANSADVDFGAASGLPINSIDIFLVFEKSKRGDSIEAAKESARPVQEDPNDCKTDSSVIAPPSSLGDLPSSTDLALA